MEVLSCHLVAQCHRVSSRLKSGERKLSSHPSKLLSTGKQSYIYVLIKSRRDSFNHRHKNFCPLKSLDSKQVATSLHPPKAISRESYGHVIDERSLKNMTESGDSIPKVLIPSSEDEPNGSYGAAISSSFWEWKPKLNVHYEMSGPENFHSPQVLFLPGFGVGSFHYEKQLKDLGRDFRVWAIDFLGQGMSLPSQDPTRFKTGGELEEKSSLWGFGDEAEPWANDLAYSVDLWQEQVRFFIEEVIREPVYLVGNSLGGFVALYFAARNPQLVKGITLLNATPFWGFLPNPVKSPRVSRIFPWAGTFPLPSNVRKLVEIVWQKISEPKSIGEILKQVYADHSTNVDNVFSRILETTEHPAAAASFASIMFAPQGELSFGESLSRCHMEKIPICLMYGKEDPWVKPVWGLQVKRQVPEAPYYQISPAGHCPHDEVPEVVNYLLRGWISHLESLGSVALPMLDNEESIQSDLAKDLEFVRDGSRKSVRVWFYGSNFSLWGQLGSFIKSGMEDLKGVFR